MHNAQSVSETKNVDVKQLVRGIDQENLKEKFERCKHFHADSEIEKGRYRVFKNALDIRDAHLLRQKSDTVFQKLKCAGK